MIDFNNIKHIHCIGIGGIGLSAIAEILLNRGYTVSGSDMKESEIVDKLIKKGAIVYLGHRERNVEGADLVVYSAAVGETNPEMVRAKELEIPCVTRGEMLGRLMEEYKNSIAVSGTHGKTTTTSMISLILERAKLDPTILVGGNLGEIGGNARVGAGDYFITEACEYMDSFLSLRPRMEIILNIDSDHLDYFKDIDHIVRSFKEFASYVPKDGKIIAYDANPFVHNATEDIANLITFGYGRGCDYSLFGVNFGESGFPSFGIRHKGEDIAHLTLKVPGEHNILNALAAFACANELGVPVDTIVSTLEDFKGTARRFDVVGMTAKGVTVVDDYAHHPTEIKATLSAAKRLPHRSLWCLFQPHTYTRTRALMEEFADSFADADKVVFADIYAAREKNIHGVSSQDLLDTLKRKHPDAAASYLPGFPEISDFVNSHAEPGDLVITMGAGDIYKVGEMLLEM